MPDKVKFVIEAEHENGYSDEYYGMCARSLADSIALFNNGSGSSYTNIRASVVIEESEGVLTEEEWEQLRIAISVSGVDRDHRVKATGIIDKLKPQPKRRVVKL